MGETGGCKMREVDRQIADKDYDLAHDILKKTTGGNIDDRAFSEWKRQIAVVIGENLAPERDVAQAMAEALRELVQKSGVVLTDAAVRGNTVKTEYLINMANKRANAEKALARYEKEQS
jgi:hypothetical protein